MRWLVMVGLLLAAGLTQAQAAERPVAHDLRGQYRYMGQGSATLTQNGNAVRVLATWAPQGRGPHYEMRGQLHGNTIFGHWYALAQRRGWYRWVATIRPNGDIDFVHSEDPIRANFRSVVLTRVGAPPQAAAPKPASPAKAKPMTGGSVEAKFRGDWVPARAACSSPLRLTVGATTVAFVNGAQRAEYDRLDQCFTCAAGASQQQQPVWLTTDAMGDSPFIVVLDGTRKTPAVTVDFSNDRRLGARFPFGSAELKKCP